MPTSPATTAALSSALGRTRTQEPVRKKAKSRHGCARCKERKIKCDETKPECLQCRKSRGKLRCPGYPEPLRFVSWNESMANPDSNRRQARSTSSTLTENVLAQLENTNWSYPVDGDGDAQALDCHLLDPDMSILDDMLNRGMQTAPQQAFDDFADFNMSSWPLSDHGPEGFGTQLPTSLPSPTVDFDDSSPAPHVTTTSPVEDITTPMADPLHPKSESFSLYLPRNGFRSFPYSQRGSHGLPRSLDPQPVHLPTMLVEYWFKRVCPVLSVFDSPKNPLRQHVARLWQSSPPLYNAIISMAAACIEDQLPHLNAAKIAMSARRASEQKLTDEMNPVPDSEDLTRLEGTLMTCHLLGCSSSWLDGTGLGLQYFEIASKLVNRVQDFARVNSSSLAQTSYSFFQEGMAYWEMLLCAAGAAESLTSRPADGPVSPSSRYDSADVAASNSRAIAMPHPITGSGIVAQRLLAMALILGRKQRKLQQTGRFSSSKDLAEGLENIRAAEAVEEALLQIEPMTEDDFHDTEDSSTPPPHLVQLSDIHKSVAMLVLYKGFPDLACRRFGGLDSDFKPSEYLTDLALSVVDSLWNIPLTSGIRSMVPVLLVMIASELQFESSPGLCESFDVENIHISQRDLEVSRARSFILDCMHFYGRCLPPRPIAKGIQLVQTVWKGMDRSEKLDWMDVMVGEGLSTIFC